MGRMAVLDDLRQRLADALRDRVAGPGAEERAAQLIGAPGPRWFADDRPIRTVHADASMFVGGLRALLLQRDRVELPQIDALEPHHALGGVVEA